MDKDKNFFQKVYEVVKKIPAGKVATYQQVATIVSTPRAAQAVGWALRALSENQLAVVPWQRVINSKGMISIENLKAPKEYQAKLLKDEGVEVRLVENNYFIDLKKYLWDPHTN
ncbi:methylated-DNA--[protein]-cysteine S-methyltransferase [Candidatus Parcubacteria bacterium]|nr:MAG: methylated-DNA--[protein]-cysteine S-methyltransferase [Candidatus Parcubacteria bacterium]